LLDHYGLLPHFSFFVFSDEIGCAKPDPRVFEAAAKGLGVALNEIVHVGDREEKDIAGPQAVGARGIFTTVVMDRGVAKSRADGICRDYRDLTAVVDRLNT
jgi:putative hydrolase of the HAD superfamily